MTLRSRWSTLPHAQARGLAIPAIASNIAVPLVGLTDTALLGHFSDAVGLGAVGLGSAVIATVFWAFAFLRPGTTSLVGRAFGAGREEDAIRHLQRALALAAALGTLWLALQWLIVPLVVRMLSHGAAAGPVATDYALIRGLSLPAVLLTLASVGFFIGRQNTRTPLLIAATVAGTNVVGDIITVAILDQGAVGAAWATFIAEWVGAALAIVLVRRNVGEEGWATLMQWRHPAMRTGWRQLASMNSHLVLRSGLLMGAITVVASIGSRFGDHALAAHAIMLQMMYLASYALDGYATAAETIAAAAIGARKGAAFHRANIASSAAAAVIAIVMTLVFWVAREPILAILTSIPDVTDVARDTWWAVVALPVVSGAAWMLDGVFLGTGRSRDMMWSMAGSVLIVFAALVAVPLALDSFTNAWLWIAFLAMNVTRAITLGWQYVRLTRTSRWIEHVT